MSTMDAEERLRDYLLDGVAKEIFWADEAYALVAEIGKYADQINTADFGPLFGRLQEMLSERQTLSIAKIFDPPSNRFPTRSIPSILKLLEDEAAQWNMPEREKLYEVLVKSGASSGDLENLSNADLTHEVVAHFRSTLPSPARVSACNLSRSLDALRESRNKVIAHNEAVDPATRQQSTWKEAESLVNYAKEFIIIIAYGYLNLRLQLGNGEYTLTHDARRPSYVLKRLLSTVGIAKDSLPVD